MAYTPTAGVFVNGQVIDAIDFNTEFALVSVGMAEDVTLLNQAIIDAINDLIANGADDFVMLVGAQSIPGAKTFNGGLEMSSTAPDLKVTNTVADDATGSRVSLLESTGTHGGIVQHDGSANQIKIIGLNGGVETDHVVIDRVTGDIQFNGTVTGPVTFDNSPATTASQGATTGSLTRRDYVDGLDAANVKLTGSQNVGGNKTFTDKQRIHSGADALTLRSTSDGITSVTYLEFEQLNGTRNGFMGFGSPSSNKLDIFNDIGEVVITDPRSGNVQGTDNASLTRKDYVDGAISTLDGDVVKLTGNQTVAGEKTFSTNPKSSAAQSTATTALTRKDYVDSLDAANVKTTGSQNIGGAKTFTDKMRIHTANEAITLRGANVGNSNTVFLELEDSAGTRQGFVGMGSSGSQDVAVHADNGNVSITNPVAPNAQGTAIEALTRKDYVDGLDGANVKLTGNQLIVGNKDFLTSDSTWSGHSYTNHHGAGLSYTHFFPQGYAGGITTHELRASNGAGGNIVSMRISDYVSMIRPRSLSGQENATAALTRKDYVDGLDNANVKTTGTQSINGVKTFEDDLRVHQGGAGFTLRGEGDSTTNTCFVEYEQSNGTRNGWVGFGSSGHSDMNVFNDVGDVYVTRPHTNDAQGTSNAALTRKDYVDQHVLPAEYASSTIGGTVKMRVSGTDLFITNDGSNA